MSGARERWLARIQEWQASGLSQADFCRQSNLNVVTFASWKRRLLRPTQESAPAFVEVGRTVVGWPLRITVGRFQVDVGADADEALLKRVLRSLEPS
jgi:hypothetical protein